MTMHTPPHPGHMLKMVFDNDCDKERQLEIRHEIRDGRLAEIMNETSDIDPHTAFLLEKMGVSSSEFWNRLQENYNNSLALPGYDFKPLKCLRVIDIDTGEILLETSSFFLFYNATFNIMERDSVERIMFEAVLESGHVINISQKTIDFETSLQVRLDKDTLSIARSPCGNILLKKEGTPVHEYLTVLDFGGYDEDLRVTQTGVDLSNTLASIKTQGDIGSTHITHANLRRLTNRKRIRGAFVSALIESFIEEGLEVDYDEENEVISVTKPEEFINVVFTSVEDLIEEIKYQTS